MTRSATIRKQSLPPVPKVIYDILTHSVLRFGRSKTAQYSSCELIKAEISPISNSVKTIKAGEQFIVLLLSDVLIPDEMGGYDISVQGLCKALGNGIEKLECDRGEKVKRSALRYRIIAGYTAELKADNISAMAKEAL